MVLGACSSSTAMRMWPSDARGESNSIWSNPQYHSNRSPTCRRDSTKRSLLRHPSWPSCGSGRLRLGVRRPDRIPRANQPDSDWNPTTRLEDWLEAAAQLRPTATEAVWLHVTRGNTVTRDAPITAAAINNVVQRRARSADLENASGYSAHSLRAGFVTEAKNRGIDEADIMRHTRHKSVQIMRRYDRTSGLWIRNATTGVSL